MRKLLAILFALCICVSLAACENAPQKESNNENAISVSSQKAENATFGLNDIATFKNLKITATKLEESNGKNFFYADEGKVFVGINFEIENISDESQNISSILLFDAYSDDIKCEYSMSANIAFGDGTLDGEIAPGKKLIGWYAVEVPQEWKQIELEFKADLFSKNKAKFVFNK